MKSHTTLRKICSSSFTIFCTMLIYDDTSWDSHPSIITRWPKPGLAETPRETPLGVIFGILWIIQTEIGWQQENITTRNTQVPLGSRFITANAFTIWHIWWEASVIQGALLLKSRPFPQGVNLGQMYVIYQLATVTRADQK